MKRGVDSTLVVSRLGPTRPLPEFRDTVHNVASTQHGDVELVFVECTGATQFTPLFKRYHSRALAHRKREAIEAACMSAAPSRTMTLSRGTRMM